MVQDASLHINTNFATVVYVNTNQFNQVINARSFSDDALTIGAREYIGDSNTSLPRIDRLIDIAPIACY